jgi:hypothetical protein
MHPASSRGYDARSVPVHEPLTPPGSPPRRYEPEPEPEPELEKSYSSFHDVDAPQPEPVVLDYGKVVPVPIKKKKILKKEIVEEKDSDYLYEDIV